MADANYTVQREDYRKTIKVINALAGLACKIPGVGLDRLDPKSILAAGRRTTGLHDWGSDEFRAPMDKVLAAADAAPMTTLGRIMMRQGAISAVSNRLRAHDYEQRHPAVVDTPIKRPLFILGFPRTGTTVLQNLLCLDAGSRSLKFWELLTPVPVYEDAQRDKARRHKTARDVIKLAYFVAPEQRFIHEIKVDTAEECWPLFQMRFSAFNNDLANGLATYGRWLLQQDMVPAYQDYARFLRMLAYRTPTERYVLKCPEHLWFLDALLEVFPDAGIVWTHRDPAESVASYCSLISLANRNFYGHIDNHGLGKRTTDRFYEGVERAMAARARLGEDRFFDVDFRELVQDQVGMVRRIKDWHGIPHDDASDERMRTYLANKRGDAKGKHVYGTRRYGIDPAAVHARYKPYIDRFNIPLRDPESLRD